MGCALIRKKYQNYDNLSDTLVKLIHQQCDVNYIQVLEKVDSP